MEQPSADPEFSGPVLDIEPGARAAPATLRPPGWVPRAFYTLAARCGYDFVQAEGALRAAAYRLRREIFVEAGYIGADEYGEAGFIDRYDPHSVVFLALHHGMPVGTLRLILPRPSTQVLDQYATRLPEGAEQDGLVEMGRLAILREHRRRGRWVMLGLLGAALAWSQAQGLRWWIGNAPQRLVDSIRLLCDVTLLPQLPLEARQVEARKLLAGYFATLGPSIQLIAIDLRSLRISPLRVLGSMWPGMRRRR